jgi:UDP-N-acetylglucosamine transferase subunit ALG13
LIFVTVGTHHQPFERLIEALAQFRAEDLVVQHGCSSAPDDAVRACPYMTFPSVLQNLERAQSVITHAGVGSIMLALSVGHTPVVVARLRRFGEHVDDHQVELTAELAREGKVLPVWDTDTLAEVVASAPPRATPVPRRPQAIHWAVRAALRGEAGQPLEAAYSSPMRNAG